MEIMATPLPRKAVKQPYVPTQAARDALAACVAALEALNVQEKGHVVARLGDMYHLQRVKPKKEVDRKTKEAWKVEWEQTPQYKHWQAAKLPKDAPKDPGAQAEYQSLQQAAMAKRAEIKARFLVAGKVKPSPTPVSSSTRPIESDEKTA